MYQPPRQKPQMPHVKRRCHRCRGAGRVPCQFCGGKGEVRTGSDIYNRPIMSRCSSCFGLKALRCSTCSGEGLA